MTPRVRPIVVAVVAWMLGSSPLPAQNPSPAPQQAAPGAVEPIALADPGIATKLALDAALAGVGPATAPESEPLPRYDAPHDVHVADLLRACVPETRAYYARLASEHMRLSTSYAPAPAPAPGSAQARRSTDENEARQILLQDADRIARSRPASTAGDLAFYESELSAGASSNPERHRFLACISWRRALHPVVSPGLPPPTDPKPKWTSVPLARATPDSLSADLIAGCGADLVQAYRTWVRADMSLPRVMKEGAAAGASPELGARFSKTTGTSDGDIRQMILWYSGVIRSADREGASALVDEWGAKTSAEEGPRRFLNSAVVCLANRRIAQITRGALLLDAASLPPVRSGSGPASILGRRDISMTCPGGAKLVESGAQIENDTYRRAFTWGNGGEGFTALVFSRDDEAVTHVDGVVNFKGIPAAWPVHVVAGMYNGAYRGLGTFGPERSCRFVMSPAK